MLDELGDVLFQVHFLALLLEERGAGDMASVADNCRQKLIRRHPHVFREGGDRDPPSESAVFPREGPDPRLTSADVLRNWDRIKVEVEGAGAGELFADVPENLPALLYARKMQRRAASRAEGSGLPADHLEALGRAREEIAALEAITATGADAGPGAEAEVRDEIERRLGEALFSIVDAARRLKADPELALRAASARFRAEGP